MADHGGTAYGDYLKIECPPEVEARTQYPLQAFEAPVRNRPGRRKAGKPGDVETARMIGKLTCELFELSRGGMLPRSAARRRPETHIRQIAMYLCRVVLSMPYRLIAEGFGRDRSTVVHACAVVEDRRDLAAYDAFVESCERCVRAAFGHQIGA